MYYLKLSALFCFFIFITVPAGSAAEVLMKDTVWSGRVMLNDDVLVPEGVMLTVARGAVINVMPSVSTKTNPEYLSSLTEITVRGSLKVLGDKDEKVLFNVKGENGSDLWGGIIIDGGTVNVRGGRIENAEAGITVIKGLLKITDSLIQNNYYGVVAYKEAIVNIENTEVTGNAYGVFELAGPKISYKRATIRENEQKDLYLYGSRLKRGINKRSQSIILKGSSRECSKDNAVLRMEYQLEDREITKKYGEGFLLADTVWSGRVEISGLIRVPENVRLIIMPGTTVEFRKKDIDGNGIGENGLLIQGVLIAKGTKERPIIFRSAETPRRKGDWDGIHIKNSNGALNLIEYVQIEHAYRGLKFLFSNAVVNASVLKNNYRAAEFQDSAVQVRNSYIFDNKSGVWAGDSEIHFTGNTVFNNIQGTEFVRTSLSAEDNKMLNNMNEAFTVRSGSTIIGDNFIHCNRFGLKISDTYFGKFNRNIIINSVEAGVSLTDSDNVDLDGNFIQRSGLDGITVRSSGGIIQRNHISKNGARGIALQSFTGNIIGNIIAGNRAYAVENESGMDILAPMNWWGARRFDKVIYDKFDDRTRGMIISSPALLEPEPFEWPSSTIKTNIVWLGAIAVKRPVYVSDGAVLTIAPETKVAFAEGSGLTVTESRIIAKGKDKKRIMFTALNKKPESFWGEILLEHATGSIFSFCDFEYATWAIHSHFTNLKVLESTFIKNDGGVRFRSGPVEISGSLFTKNRIALRAFLPSAVIKENEIVNNETGIFVREKGDGLTIRTNNIYSNKDYNIRVGDFNVEDIDARDNWWGTDKPEETIFDGRREPGVGKVIFEPVLIEKRPFGDEEEEEEKDGEGKNDEPQVTNN